MAKSDRRRMGRTAAPDAVRPTALEAVQFHYRAALHTALGFGPNVGLQGAAALDRGESALRHAEAQLDRVAALIQEETQAAMVELTAKCLALTAENEVLRASLGRRGAPPSRTEIVLKLVREEMLKAGIDPVTADRILGAALRRSGQSRDTAKHARQRSPANRSRNKRKNRDLIRANIIPLTPTVCDVPKMRTVG